MIFEATGEELTLGAFWRALGCRPVGAVVVTAKGELGPTGFLGLSFAHVSAQPPMVLVSVGRSASALNDIKASGAFAVNFLPAGAEEMAKAFGRSADRGNRFTGDGWTEFVTGSPVLIGASGVFDCTVATTLDTEAALIVVGEVVGLRADASLGATLAAAGGFQDFLN